MGLLKERAFPNPILRSADTAMKRVILHCDCNNFFASVETVLNPDYKGVPMAVCGSEEDRHGIVLAKNELAKKYGIKTAETVYSAKKKCPNLVIAKPHHSEYARYSKRVNEIYARYTDMIEPFGIDESWLDVTASRRLFGNGEEIAERIRREVKEELGITVSIGVSFNKIFAKLGSDYKKPDAVTVINEENYKSIVYPLPVGDMLYIGKRTCDELSSLGIRTIGALAGASAELLSSKFGKMGQMMHKYALGLDDSPVSKVGEFENAKSIGSGLTFKHDLMKKEEWIVGLNHLSDDVARRLRAEKMKCSTVQLTVKDHFLRVIQRQRPVRPETDLAREIAAVAYSILLDEWSEGEPIRMLTVTASSLIPADMSAEQLDIFGELDISKRDKEKKKEETVDKIRQKYGSSSIINAGVIGTDIGIKAPKSLHDDE